MINKNIIIFLRFSLTVFLLLPFSFQEIKSQCSPPFIEAECYGAVDMNILETIEFAKKRNLQGSTFSNSAYSSVIKKFKDPVYFQVMDSLFQVCKSYMISQFGKENYCKRIRFSYYSTLSNFLTRYPQEPRKFHFEFYYEDINCWQRTYIKLIFPLIENESGKYNITYPELPICSPNDCDFDYADFNEGMEKAIEMDLLDPRFNTNINHDINDLEFSYSDLPFQSRQVFMSRKNGAIMKDTTFDKTSNPYKQTPSSKKVDYTLDQIIDKADVIVDATFYESITYNRDGLSYDRVLLKVHHVLKGDQVPNITAIDFSQRMQRVFGHEYKSGSRNLFALSDEKLEPHNLRLVQSDSIKVWNTFQVIPTQNYPNIYSKIFPHILQRTGQKIKKSNSLNYASEEIKSWLRLNNHNTEEEGLVTGFGYLRWGEGNDKITANISLSSAKDYTYLVFKEFEIEYDTLVVGSEVVKNKNVAFDPFLSVDGRSVKLLKTVLGANYEVELDDVAPNRLGIKIRLQDSEKIAQIAPAQLSSMNNKFSSSLDEPNYASNNFINLSFNVKPSSKQREFKIRMVLDSFDIKDSYYDFSIKKEKVYDYQYVFKKEASIGVKRQNPIIHKVEPGIYTVGDTITLFGENLDMYPDKIKIPCTAVIDDILCSRYCWINKSNIVKSAYDELSFIVSEQYMFRNIDYIFHPANGLLKVNHSYGPEVIFKYN